MTRHPPVPRKHVFPLHFLSNMTIVSLSFKNVMYSTKNSYEKMKIFKHLGSLLRNQYSIHEEIKCSLKAWNLCYYLVEALLSSRRPSKNLKRRIYKRIILPVVLYVYGTWSLTSWKERRLRVFVNRSLRQIFEPKENENGEWGRLHNGELHSFYQGN